MSQGEADSGKDFSVGMGMGKGKGKGKYGRWLGSRRVVGWEAWAAWDAWEVCGGGFFSGGIGGKGKIIVASLFVA